MLPNDFLTWPCDGERLNQMNKFIWLAFSLNRMTYKKKKIWRENHTTCKLPIGCLLVSSNEPQQNGSRGGLHASAVSSVTVTQLAMLRQVLLAFDDDDDKCGGEGMIRYVKRTEENETNQKKAYSWNHWRLCIERPSPHFGWILVYQSYKREWSIPVKQSSAKGSKFGPLGVDRHFHNLWPCAQGEVFASLRATIPPYSSLVHYRCCRDWNRRCLRRRVPASFVMEQECRYHQHWRKDSRNPVECLRRPSHRNWKVRMGLLSS